MLKQKGESQRVLQENEARQIFRKTNVSAYQGVRNVRFSENLLCFVTNTYFEICPFALLPTICFLLHELSDTTMTPQKIRL